MIEVRDWMLARVAMATLWFLRKLPPDKALNFAGAASRRIGPLLGRHRTAVDNLRKAFPEKSEQQVEALALEMWDNMARLAAEYIFLDQLFDADAHMRPDGRIDIVGEELFHRLASEQKPHILITAHLGNFELLPMAASIHGLKVTALFRPPNNRYVADYLLSRRKANMGELLETRVGAAFGLSAILEKGGNVGALVDQKFQNGVETTFFGRPCETNPVVPMLARRFDCPVHPARCIRLPGNRYRLEIHDALDLPRGTNGEIDVAASAQMLNDVVEGWVRENPGQWMWFHKRWALSGRKRRRRAKLPSSGPKPAA